MNYQPSFTNNMQSSFPIWVQGEAGANAYMMLPNSTVWLMDSQDQYLYIKRTDAVGRPYPLEKYRLVKEDDYQPTSTSNGYVSSADLENRLNAFMEELNSKFVIRKPRKEQING